jgi:hypothetical protein
MKFVTTLYLEQMKKWPSTGRHILAQYDDDSLIVYQAYRPAIGDFAVNNNYLGGEFRLDRTSWIKTNFLWMMYRSSWGTKTGQEVILAVRIKMSFFLRVLSLTVETSFVPELFASRELWREALTLSNVKLQWDPDHAPDGKKCERKAIQLGLCGNILEEYSKDAILDIIDVSSFVREQRKHVESGDGKVVRVGKTGLEKQMRKVAHYCQIGGLTMKTWRKDFSCRARLAGMSKDDLNLLQGRDESILEHYYTTDEWFIVHQCRQWMEKMFSEKPSIVRIK